MNSVGCGEEKINCSNIREKRAASTNNSLTSQNGSGNGKLDKSFINDDSHPSIEYAEDEIVSREDHNPYDKELDIPAMVYQGETPAEILEFKESFDELLEKFKSFKRACDESRLNLANRTVSSIVVILDKFNVPHDLRGPFLEGYDTHEDRERALHDLRKQILNLFDTENVFENLFFPGGRQIHVEHQTKLREAFNKEHPNHNHSNSVVTMDMIKRLVGKGQIGKAAKSMSQTESPVVIPDSFSNKIINLSKDELNDIKKN